MSTTEAAPVHASEREWRSSACILCECNCGIEVAVEGRTLAAIRGDKDHHASKGYTCNKAMRLDLYQNGPHRLTSPLRRRPDGSYEEIDWDTAIREVAAGFKKLADEHGGTSIFYYGGGGQGNHLGGAYSSAFLKALGSHHKSNALAQEKTGEGWIDSRMRGSPADAERLGIADGARARVTTAAGSAETVVEVSAAMQPGHASLPNGYGLENSTGNGEGPAVGIAPNSLTSSEWRDEFAGTPWHKHVPARLEPATSEPAASSAG